MALAECTHHASRGQTRARGREEVVQATYEAPRGQMAPPPGARLGIFAEPGPQRSDRTVRAHPTLGLPVLAGASGEEVDASTLAFLSREALVERMAEEWKAEAGDEAGGAAAGGARGGGPRWLAAGPRQ